MANYNSLLLVRSKDVSELAARAVDFYVAYNFANMGHRVIILTKNIEVWREVSQLFVSSCEAVVLERIYFRYYTKYQDVVDWCYRVQHFHRKPNLVLFESFGDVCDHDGVQIYSVAAALLTVAEYCSTFRQGPKHTFALVVSTLDTHTTSISNLFQRQLKVPAFVPDMNTLNNVDLEVIF